MQIYNQENCKQSIGNLNLQMHNLITALLLLKDNKHTTQNFSTTKELHLLEI